MTSFWAIMHLVAAALTAEVPIPNFMEWTDGVFAIREQEHDELRLVEAYAVLLGMPEDEAFVMALCRADRREAFGE